MSLKSHYYSLGSPKLTKEAFSREALKTLLGKAPSSSITERANVALGGRAAGEGYLDLLNRQALVNMELGRRKGALKGLVNGAIAGGVIGGAGVPGYINSSKIESLIAKATSPGAREAAALKGLYEAMEEYPLTALTAGVAGAGAGGFIGKRVGGGLGRVKGFFNTNPLRVAADDLNTAILRRM